jgi:hypothetical protein
VISSKNQIKSTESIVKAETGKNGSKGEIYLQHINDSVMHNQQTIADSFNDYFICYCEKIIITLIQHS